MSWSATAACSAASGCGRRCLLLTAKAVGGRVDAASTSTLATVVEMIHTATLVHDDVLDEAQMRRHLATVNARWDNEASVLLGDFLFTHAFYLASTLDSVLGCRLIGRATNIVCEGELRQKGSRGNFELSEAEYLEIIEAKTAELTAVSCRLGALFAGADERLVDAARRLWPRSGHRLSDRRRPARRAGRREQRPASRSAPTWKSKSRRCRSFGRWSWPVAGGSPGDSRHRQRRPRAAFAPCAAFGTI